MDCPEGWTLYPFPGPQFENVSDSGSVQASYFTWVDQFDTLGLGKNGAAVNAYQQVSRFRFVDRERVDNITDFALNQFRDHYKSGRSAKRAITKDAIFHYVYAVLYDPIYREKYVLNLRREFPRIPFYGDFWRWADWSTCRTRNRTRSGSHPR